MLTNLSFSESIFYMLPTLGIVSSLIQDLFFVSIILVGKGITDDVHSIIAK
jgi:hypothetical protein